MNLINIYDSNGQAFDVGALGLTGLRLRIPSPSYNTITQEVDGHSGTIVMDRVLKERKINAIFMSRAKDYYDSLLLRDRLYGLLGSGKEMYVAETEQPTRWWKVYLDEWTPERFDVRTHTFEIPLTCSSGMAESVSLVKKRFTTNTFRFKNDGNVTIDPRKHSHSDTEIEFTGVSSGLTITNKTNGDSWSYSGTTVAGDKILLKSVRSLKNGVSVFGQTNKKLISINPGWNEFEITGVTEGEYLLTIRTRFYFL